MSKLEKWEVFVLGFLFGEVVGICLWHIIQMWMKSNI